MAGLLKYFVPRLANTDPDTAAFSYPVSTSFEAKRVKRASGTDVKDHVMQTKVHKHREIKCNKDGSFDLHEDDVAALEDSGFAPIPWNERTKIEVMSPESAAKAEKEAKAKAEHAETLKRQRAAKDEEKRAAKEARAQAAKEALAEAKKKAEAGSGKAKKPASAKPATE